MIQVKQVGTTDNHDDMITTMVLHITFKHFGTC